MDDVNCWLPGWGRCFEFYSLLRYCQLSDRKGICPLKQTVPLTLKGSVVEDEETEREPANKCSVKRSEVVDEASLMCCVCRLLVSRWTLHRPRLTPMMFILETEHAACVYSMSTGSRAMRQSPCQNYRTVADSIMLLALTSGSTLWTSPCLRWQFRSFCDNVLEWWWHRARQ